MGGVVGAVGRVAGDASLALAAILFAIAVFIWALFVVRKLSRDEAQARRRITELEVELNEAEAALTAEPHMLMIWRGRDARARADHRRHARHRDGAAGRGDAARFPALARARIGVNPRRGARRHAGGRAPFNIGIRTRSGELLEAEGRAAGGLATLRLGRSRASGGTAPSLPMTAASSASRWSAERHSRCGALAIWLNDEGGKLIWVNRSYMSAVDAQDYDRVIADPVLLANRPRSVSMSRRGMGGGAGAAPPRP